MTQNNLVKRCFTVEKKGHQDIQKDTSTWVLNQYKQVVQDGINRNET